MTIKLLSEYHLEFLSLKGGGTGSPESTLVKYHIVGNHTPRLKRLLLTVESTVSQFRFRVRCD